MKSMDVSDAKNMLDLLINEVNTEHEPIQIFGEKGNAILVSEKDWNALQEMLYLMSIPGMRESIIEGMKTPLQDCVEGLNW